MKGREVMGVSRRELTLSADPCNTRMGLSGAKPALISGFSRFSPRVNISAIPIRVPVSWFNCNFRSQISKHFSPLSPCGKY